MPTKRNSSELRRRQSSSYNRMKTSTMKTNSSSNHGKKRRAIRSACLWRQAMSIGVLLQILVNCGEFNYIYAHFLFLLFWTFNGFNRFIRNGIRHSPLLFILICAFIYWSWIFFSFHFSSFFFCFNFPPWIFVASLPHFHSNPFGGFFLLSGTLHFILLNSE